MKTSELTGAALDWAVSLITNPEWSDEDRRWNTYDYVDTGEEGDEPYSPSTNWAQGGPIIDREQISTYPDVNNTWIAQRRTWLKDGAVSVRRQWHWGSGSTLLIAAMRCFVASKLGDEIELPKELI